MLIKGRWICLGLFPITNQPVGLWVPLHDTGPRIELWAVIAGVSGLDD